MRQHRISISYAAEEMVHVEEGVEDAGIGAKKKVRVLAHLLGDRWVLDEVLHGALVSLDVGGREYVLNSKVSAALVLVQVDDELVHCIGDGFRGRIGGHGNRFGFLVVG